MAYEIEMVGGSAGSAAVLTYALMKLIDKLRSDKQCNGNGNRTQQAVRIAHDDTMRKQIQEIRDTMLVSKPEKQKELLYEVAQLQKNSAENINKLTKMQGSTLDKIDALVESMDELTREFKKTNGG